MRTGVRRAGCSDVYWVTEGELGDVDAGGVAGVQSMAARVNYVVATPGNPMVLEKLRGRPFVLPETYEE